MIKKTIICDRCGKEINDSNRFQKIVKSMDPSGEVEQKRYDFCSHCNGLVEDYMNFDLHKSTSPIHTDMEEDSLDVDDTDEISTDTDEISTDTASPSRAKLDIGQIIALHNAGWRNKDIADEMRITPTSVAQAIYRVKNGTVKGFSPDMLIK